MVALEARGVELVKVVRAEIGRGPPVAQHVIHVIDDDQTLWATATTALCLPRRRAMR